MSRKHLAAFVAAIVVLTVPLAASAAPDASATATIARGSAGSFGVQVTVTKTSAGGAPSATANVAAFEKTGGKWKPLGRLRIGRSNGFFWKVLTGPRAIRQFSIGNSTPQRVSVQLLVTPALGWSPVYQFHVQNGKLVAGAAR
jgi:hypothetical protein